MKITFKPNDALLIVDVQLDFFPDGPLGVAGADAIIPVVNQLIQQAELANIPIFYSRDWHPKNHCSFIKQGGIWPQHCVQNSQGANFHPEIIRPNHYTLISKGFETDKEAYSAFEGKAENGQTLNKLLKAQQCKRLFIAGLALDYCVYYSAKDALKRKYEVVIILDGCRSISQDEASQKINELKQLGCNIFI